MSKISENCSRCGIKWSSIINDTEILEHYGACTLVNMFYKIYVCNFCKKDVERGNYYVNKNNGKIGCKTCIDNFRKNYVCHYCKNKIDRKKFYKNDSSTIFICDLCVNEQIL